MSTSGTPDTSYDVVDPDGDTDEASELAMPARRGRGARINPPNGYERLHIELDPEALDDEERRSIDTTVLVDPARSILSENDSPDVPFRYSVNPYRGCEHGCVYCYARPTHEYLGYSAGLDFESILFVKKDAPKLLSDAFQKPTWTPDVVSLSGNTDPYQPVERALCLTRRCLDVFLRHRNPVSIVTKGSLITRDVDLLVELAKHNLVHVHVSVTSLQDDVAGVMEPRAARPPRRLRVIEQLTDRGIPVGVLIAPVVPGLTDHEIPRIVDAVYGAGARSIGFVMLRLPGAVEPIFIEWLRRSFPARVDKVLGRLRSLRGGALNDSQFGRRMRGEGPWAKVTNSLFAAATGPLDLPGLPDLDVSAFRPLRRGQLEMTFK